VRFGSQNNYLRVPYELDMECDSLLSDEEYWEEDAEEALESCPALDNINAWLEADKVHNYGLLTDLTACATGNGVG